MGSGGRVGRGWGRRGVSRQDTALGRVGWGLREGEGTTRCAGLSVLECW